MRLSSAITRPVLGLLAIEAMFFCSSDAAAVQPCAPVQAGVISHWRADSSTADDKYGNAGVLVNGATYSPGIAGQSFSLQSPFNQRVDVPTNTTLDARRLTVAAWVYPTSYPNAAPMIVRRDQSTPGFTLFGLSLTASGEVNLNLMGSASLVASSVPLGEWTHVAFTYDSVVVRLYVNGAEVASQSIAMSLPPSTAPLSIGGWISFANRAFDGRIDEVIFANRAMASEELQLIATAGPSSICPPSPSHAEQFYSTDPEADSLVIVDSMTGAVAAVAALGFDARNVDLARDGGELLVLNSVFGDSVDLVRMDIPSASVRSRVTLRVAGELIRSAEGLAVVEDEVFIAFNSRPTCLTCSNAIGRVLSDGAVVDVLDFALVDPTGYADADALTSAVSSGQLAWMDVNPYDSRYPFFDNYRLITARPGQLSSFDVLGDHKPYLNINDLHFGAAGAYWGIDGDRRQLYRISELDGALIDSRGMMTQHALHGLAIAGPDSLLAVAQRATGLESHLVSWPNPVRGGVRFSSPGRALMSLEVFDVTGRLVAALRGGPMVDWDLRAKDGARVDAGVYFVVEKVGDGANRSCRVVVME